MCSESLNIYYVSVCWCVRNNAELKCKWEICSSSILKMVEIAEISVDISDEKFNLKLYIEF